MAAKRILVVDRPLRSINNLNNEGAVAGELAHYDIVVCQDNSHDPAVFASDKEIIDRTLAIRSNTTDPIKFGIMVSMTQPVAKIGQVVQAYGTNVSMIALTDTKLNPTVTRRKQVDMYTTCKTFYRDVVFVCDSFSDIAYSTANSNNPEGLAVPYTPADIIVATRLVNREESSYIDGWLYDELLAMTTSFNNKRVFGALFTFDTEAGGATYDRTTTAAISGFFNHAYIGYNITQYNRLTPMVVQDITPEILSKKTNLRYLRSEIRKINREDGCELKVGQSIARSTVTVPPDYVPPTKAELEDFAKRAELAAEQSERSAASSAESAARAEAAALEALKAGLTFTAINTYAGEKYGVVGGLTVNEARNINAALEAAQKSGSGGTVIIRSKNGTDPIFIDTPVILEGNNVHLKIESEVVFGNQGAIRINGSLEEYNRGDPDQKPSLGTTSYNNAEGVMCLPLKNMLGGEFVPGDKIIVRGKQNAFGKPLEKQITFVKEYREIDGYWTIVCTDEQDYSFKSVYPDSEYEPDKVNGTQITIVVSSRLTTDIPAGVLQFEVYDGSYFKAGDTIMLGDSRTESDLDGITHFKNAANMEFAQVSKVEGNMIFLDSAVYRSYSTAFYANVSKTLMVKGSSIDVANVRWNAWQTARVPPFLCSYGDTCWMRVRRLNGREGRLGQAMRMAYSYNCVIYDSFIDGAMFFGSAEGYGATIYYSTKCSILRNRITGCRHNILLQTATACDIFDNECSDDYISSIDVHGCASVRTRIQRNRVTRSVNHSPGVSNGSAIRNGNTAHILGDDDTLIADNYIEGYKGLQAYAIDFSAASKGLVIRDNVMVDCLGGIRAFKTNDPLQPRPTAKDATISGNQFRQVTTPLQLAPIEGLLQELYFLNNSTYECAQQFVISNIPTVVAFGNLCLKPIATPNVYAMDFRNIRDLYVGTTLARGCWGGIRAENCPGGKVIGNRLDYTVSGRAVTNVGSVGLIDYDNVMGQNSGGSGGNGGMNWRGPFIMNGVYNKGDVVGLNGSSYVCNTNNTTNQDPTTSNRWDILAEKGEDGGGGPTPKPGINWRNGILMTETYVKGDAGNWLGSSYIVTAEVVQGENPATSDKWEYLAKQGDIGKPGESPELRKGSTHIEWKLPSEGPSAWRPLVALADLKGDKGDKGNPGTGGGGGGFTTRKTIALFGDSVAKQSYDNRHKTRNDGYMTWGMILSNHRLLYPDWNMGVGGDTTSKGLARVQTVIDKSPDYCIVELGGNDIATSGTANVDLMISNMTQIYDRMSAAGIYIIATSIYPFGSAQKADRNAMSAFNSWLQVQARTRPNFTLVEIQNAFMDYDGGGRYAKPGYLKDSLHPGVRGAKPLGQLLADAILKLEQVDMTTYNRDPLDIWSSSNPFGHIVANGLQMGSGGSKSGGATGSVSDSWSLTGLSGITVTASKEQNPDAPGLQRQVINVSGDGNGEVILSGLPISGYDGSAPFLEAFCEVEVVDGVNLAGVYLSWQGSATGSPTATDGQLPGISGDRNAYYMDAGSWKGQLRTYPYASNNKTPHVSIRIVFLSGKTASGSIKVGRVGLRPCKTADQ